MKRLCIKWKQWQFRNAYLQRRQKMVRWKEICGYWPPSSFITLKQGCFISTTWARSCPWHSPWVQKFGNGGRWQLRLPLLPSHQLSKPCGLWCHTVDSSQRARPGTCTELGPWTRPSTWTNPMPLIQPTVPSQSILIWERKWKRYSLPTDLIVVLFIPLHLRSYLTNIINFFNFS